jgi:hypothetical protein
MTAVTVQDFIYAQSANRLKQGGPHPASIVMFTDSGSAWHVAMGILAGAVPDPWNLATVAMFSGYEVSKLGAGESAQRTGGKFVEFGIGILLAALIQFLGGYR